MLKCRKLEIYYFNFKSLIILNVSIKIPKLFNLGIFIETFSNYLLLKTILQSNRPVKNQILSR